MKILLYLALFTAPMGAHLLSFSFGPFQMSPFRIFVLAEIVCLLFSCFRGKTLRLWTSKEQRYAVCFHLIWFVYAVVSLTWAVDFSSWFKGIYFLFIGVAGVIIADHVVRDAQTVQNALISLQLGVLVQSAIGWYEIATRNYLFKEMLGKNYTVFVLRSRRIPIAMMNNPNDFATLMFFGAVIAWFFMGVKNKKWLSRLSLAMLVNCVILLFMTTSRANVIALLIASAFLILVNKKKKIWLIMVAVIASVLLIPQLTESLETLLSFNFDAASGSDAVRLVMIENGFHFLLDTFGFGVGSGQVETWMASRVGGDIGDIANMHNWWMELLTTYGVPVFIGYMVYYCKMFRTFFMRGKNLERGEKRLPISFCAAMAGFVIACVSASSNISCEWLWMFWAICVAYLGLTPNNSCEVQS